MAPGMDSSLTNQALQKLGRVVDENVRKTQAAFAKVQKERDVAQAHDAAYKFNDAARAKYAELRRLQGGDAVELDRKYDEWYQTTSRDVASNLANVDQQTIFKNQAESRRARDLDSLMAYEIGEHENYMKSVLESNVAGTKKDAALYADNPNRIDKLIGDSIAWVDAAYPGKDNSIMKQAIADDVHSIAIMTQAERNPQLAKAMLERWRVSPAPLYVTGKPSGLLEKGNIDINNRPIVKNSDGSISTVRSISITIDGGKTVLLPTIGPNGEKWTDEQAIDSFRNTGKHLGIFDSIENADKYADSLHNQQAARYSGKSRFLLSPSKALDLSKDVDKEFLYFEAKTRFADFNSQYDWVKGMKNVDEDVKRQVMGRINADQAEAENRENKSIEDKTKSWRINDLNAWHQYRTGQLTREKLDNLAEIQSISAGTYNAIINEMRNPATANNPIVVGEIAEKIALGEDATTDLETAMSEGQITTETYLSMRTNVAKKGFSDAKAFITSAIKPPEFYYNPDKSLAYAEAIKSFNVRVSSGEDPWKVANEIVQNNTSNIRRSLVGLAVPTYLKGGAKAAKDIDALEAAKFETAMAFQKGDLTVEEYSYQIGIIQERINLVNEMNQSIENSEGLDAEVQKQLKLNR